MNAVNTQQHAQRNTQHKMRTNPTLI